MKTYIVLIVCYLFVSCLIVDYFSSWEYNNCPAPHMTTRDRFLFVPVVIPLILTMPIWALFTEPSHRCHA